MESYDNELIRVGGASTVHRPQHPSTGERIWVGEPGPQSSHLNSRDDDCQCEGVQDTDLRNTCSQSLGGASLSPLVFGDFDPGYSTNRSRVFKGKKGLSVHPLQSALCGRRRPAPAGNFTQEHRTQDAHHSGSVLDTPLALLRHHPRHLLLTPVVLDLLLFHLLQYHLSKRLESSGHPLTTAPGSLLMKRLVHCLI